MARVVLVGAAAGVAQEQAVAMAAPRGRISLFAGLPADSHAGSWDPNAVHYRELTVVGASGSSPAHNAAALEQIASGQVPVRDLIHTVPPNQVRAGIELVAHGDAIKVTIEP